MIKRFYFYHFTLQSDKPKFANGIVVAQSWFADGNKAFGVAIDRVCEHWQCERSKARCDAFNRI